MDQYSLGATTVIIWGRIWMKGVTILKEYNSDSQVDSVTIMHTNIFIKVQRSGITKIHLRAWALELWHAQGQTQAPTQ